MKLNLLLAQAGIIALYLSVSLGDLMTQAWRFSSVRSLANMDRLWRSLLLGTLAVYFVTSLAAKEPDAKPAAKGAETKQGETKPVATPEPSIYLRILRDDQNEPSALQTSIVRFARARTDAKVAHVDLIGAVHVGEKSYYEQLNKQFEKYDAVLYELVAPEGTRVPKGATANSSHPLGAMQNGMKEMLGLEHQLTIVDYHPKNLIHADMSPEKFGESMTKRNESVFQMVFRAMGYSIARQNARDPAGLQSANMLAAMMSGNSVGLKRELAKQFEDIDNAVGMFNGPDGSTILTERNKVALEVLKKQLEAGKKKIAIFYGAAHLPDMAQRLEKEFHLERREVEWVTAWDLRDTKK